MDWQLILAIGINTVTVAMAAATLWSKVSFLERDIIKLEKEVIDSRTLKEDLAVMKEQLRNISICLQAISKDYHDRYNEHKETEAYDKGRK